MAKFKFYLKDPKAEKTTSIMLVCQWSNQQVKVYTGKTILPEFWNSKEGKARNIREFKESRKLNAFLAAKEEEAKNLYWEMELRMKRPPTKSEYKDALQTLLETGKINLEKEIPTFEEFVEGECKIMQAGSDCEGRSGQSSTTADSYRDALSALRKFNGTRRAMRFEDFTMEFYGDFVHYCTFAKNYKPNTIKSLLTAIKAMLKRAWEKGLHSNMDYQKFKKPSDLPDTVYLGTDELEKMMKLKFKLSEKRLEKARDLFVLACWTGLRVSDWGKLSQLDLSGQFFTIMTRKTRQRVTLPVLPVVRQINDKYRGSFPMPGCLGVLNDGIREVARRAGITQLISHTETKGGKTTTREVPKYQRISSHTARRSFATNLYNMGVPPVDIMKLTGHLTEIAFMRYLRITSTEAASRILEIFNKQNTSPIVRKPIRKIA